MLELTKKISRKANNASSIKQAVILAAGLGSRLAKTPDDIKPLKLVGGVSLIQRNIELFVQNGIEEVIIVTGYHAHELEAQLTSDCAHLPVKLTFRFNPDFRKSNGLSVLCAQSAVRGNFILTMADHIFAPEMVADACSLVPPQWGALLCVDYKLNTIFDMDDATKVLVEDGKVASISKKLTNFNAVDTGLFVCTPTLFEALNAAADLSPIHDCSLSEGIATLMKTGRMAVHDIGSFIWQDVDDDYMLKQAESLVKTRLSAHVQSPRLMAVTA